MYGYIPYIQNCKYRIAFINWAFHMCHYTFHGIKSFMPIPVAARSKRKVYGRSPTEIVGSNPDGA
jgi:hypothetical protein